MNNDFFTISDCVILCNGAFPTHSIPLAILRQAQTIICCDGATQKLVDFGLEPSVIVGDFDSVPPELLETYSDRLFYNPDCEINDLSKAVKWAISHDFTDITILGATGLRTDHAIGNISLLVDYLQLTPTIRMISDQGVFTPIHSNTKFCSFIGQQVSIFSLNPTTKISAKGVKYPLPPTLQSWWQGALNESLGNEFEIFVQNGQIIVFQLFEDI